ncbi:MAG TPA: alpha-L-arabinofuranosidase C-terminal domain-containing protein [Steroidobacteraceae bacterium]
MHSWAASAERAPFGELPDGTAIEALTLRNAHGVSARIITYGATLQALVAPDRQGHPADIALGYDDLAGYVPHPNYFGAPIGRFANRIAGARFSLDGKTYSLALNDKPNSLHGGLKGFDKQVWRIDAVQSAAQASVTLSLTSPGGDQGYPGSKTDYIESVMKAWHDTDWSWDIEAVSLHSYTSAGWPPAHPSTGFGEDQYARLLGDTLHMEQLISAHSALMDRYDPQKKVALAVDEWGIWLAPLAGTNPGFLVQQNSLRDAILGALNLNIFARHADRVRMANIAQMENVLQAMILTDGARMVLTPTYHLFHMYVPFQDASALPVHVAPGRYVYGAVSLPRVDAIAARTTDGHVVLSLVNLDPTKPVTIRTHLNGGRLRCARGEQLTAPQVDAINTFDHPATVVPKPLTAARTAEGVLLLTLPAKSVSVLQLD